jgi:CBS domain-containing protein
MTKAYSATSRHAASIELVRVSEAMHRGVVRCDPATGLGAIARLLAAHRIHAVVVGSGDGAGIVSDLALLEAAADGRFEATAAELASPSALRVRLDDSVAAAAQLMSEHATRHALVVVPGSGRVVGILSTLDVADVLAELL